MSFFSGLNFWLVFILMSIPAVIIGIREKKSKYYILGVSLVFCVMVYSKKINSLISLTIFVIYEFLLIKLFLKLKKEKNFDKVYIFVLLSLLPLILARVLPFTKIHYRLGTV